ncbi:LysR family transcriptional regulator [Microbaculum marinum]|uniref:LysR substrate-binding domain-containing protein n=1 Tax=Microbaculum marinum TaxID=1764581 RepID=A0AAW9RXB0_9HYPH
MTHSPLHLDRLRLRHLRLLALIDEHRSLRAVAGVFKLTQPAISQMVKDLEHAFGVTLVERSARGVSLTTAGEIALQRARSGLAAFDHLAGELHADHPPVVRIGTNPAVMFQLLPAAIGRLEACSARFRFKIRAGMVNDMLDELWDGNLDCYIGRVDWDRLPQRMANVLRHDPLTETDLVLACSITHPLAGRTDLSAAELLDWSWALPPDGSNNRTVFDAAFRNHGLASPVPTVEIAADPNALIMLARHEHFLICIPRNALDSHVLKEVVCVLDLPDLRFPPIQIGFVTLAQNEAMTSVETLRQALADVAQPTARMD